MNEQIKILLLNFGPFALLLMVFLGIFLGGRKLLTHSAEVAADIQKNAQKGDELSIEVAKNARILSHQYLFSLSSTAMISLILHSVIFQYWKTYISEETGTVLMMVLILIVGIFSVAQQTSRVKAIAEQFNFPIVNMKNYAASLAFGIIWLCVSLRRPENSGATEYALGMLVAILIPTILFEIVCQKWVLSAYSGVGHRDGESEGEL